jgi:hypothetical protein
VRGTLVAAGVATPLPGGVPPTAARPAAARRGTDTPSRPLVPAAGVLAALALVGLGAHRERRALRRNREVV